jgi:hypothetical protein
MLSNSLESDLTRLLDMIDDQLLHDRAGLTVDGPPTPLEEAISELRQVFELERASVRGGGAMTRDLAARVLRAMDGYAALRHAQTATQAR